MAEVKLHLEDTGWRGLISTIQNSLGSPDTLLKKAFLIIWPAEAKSHFKDEMGPDGPWAPWADSYSKFMNRIGKGGNHLLQDTGRLRTQTIFDPEFIELPNGLKVISPAPYSGFLDEGTNKMPARPFMWLGDSSQERLALLLVDALLGKAGGTD